MPVNIQDLLNRACMVRDAIHDRENTAFRVGSILVDMIQQFVESGGSDKYLSRVDDDVAEGLIQFLKGAEFGKFIQGMVGGSGGRIDAGGNAEVESLRVRTAMWVQELIVNRLQAIEGDQIFTESDTVESVEDLGNNTYRLTLSPKYDGYFTAMTQGAVLKGMINNLATGGGTYYTSWMRVNSVNTAANSIEVSLYPVEDTPEGQGYEYQPGEPTKYCPPPCELMKIARWGHQTDETRQRLFYLSSSEGRLVRYEGVTKPIIDASNWGSSFGILPSFLDKQLPEELHGAEGIYSKVIAAQNFITVDYQGRPKPVIRDRGPFVAGADYYAGDTFREETLDYEQSDVWYLGCKWRCCKTGTTAVPAWNNTDWAFVEGNPYFTIQLIGGPAAINPAKFKFELTVYAELYNQDVTAQILPADFEWTRYSEDKDGNQRVASDNVWAAKHANCGSSITFTEADLDSVPDGVPPVCLFKCTATLRDGMTTYQHTAIKGIRL